MSDYISRENAKDALQEKVFHNLTDEFYGAMQVLDELEPADVAPVVRCKECKHWDNGNLSFECPWDYGRHGSSDEDDFCSYGERREE